MFFFFKQKTAYEMRISDWSSDVCSSDLDPKVVKDTKDLGPQIKIWGNRCISCTRCVRFCDEVVGTGELAMVNRGDHQVADVQPEIPLDNQLGRASCRERVCQYAYISVVAVSLKKKKNRERTYKYH